MIEIFSAIYEDDKYTTQEWIKGEVLSRTENTITVKLETGQIFTLSLGKYLIREMNDEHSLLLP